MAHQGDLGEAAGRDARDRSRSPAQDMPIDAGLLTVSASESSAGSVSGPESSLPETIALSPWGDASVADLAENACIRLHLATLSGRVFARVSAASECTRADLLATVPMLRGSPPEIRVLRGCEELTDERTLQDMNVADGDTLTVLQGAREESFLVCEMAPVPAVREFSGAMEATGFVLADFDGLVALGDVLARLRARAHRVRRRQRCGMGRGRRELPANALQPRSWLHRSSIFRYGARDRGGFGER